MRSGLSTLTSVGGHVPSRCPPVHPAKLPAPNVNQPSSGQVGR